MHNNYFAKNDLEYANQLEQNRENSEESETKNNNEEEKKQDFTDSKDNILKNAVQIKEKGVDQFKSLLYREALNSFTQAQKLFEKEFAEEIKNKAPFVLENYIKTIRNAALSHHNLKEFQQADEKLDLLMAILPDDERALHLKANNYQEMATCNFKIYGLNYDTLVKAQDTLKKLISLENISKIEKMKYQQQLNSIQSDILMKDPEFKKSQKIVEDFETQLMTFKNDNQGLLVFLKVVLKMEK